MAVKKRLRKSRGSAEQQLAKALKHPLRVEILAVLDNKTSSPVRLSKELDESLGNVSYHVKQLLKLDCIELVTRKQRRGAMENFYRAVKRPYFHDEDWRGLPRMARQGISSAVIGTIADDAAKSFDAGAFDARDDRHLSRTPLVLDERGWGELQEMLNGVVERGLALQEQAAERIAEKGARGFPVRMVLMGFESGGGAEQGKS